MPTKKYGLIGRKLSHSFSKKYFEQKFIDQEIDATYDLFEIESLAQLSSFLNITDCLGLNITIPYKQSVFQFIQEPDEIVKKCGAINAIKQIAPHRWAATNTDVVGFKKSLFPLLQLQHKSAIVLGNGGAAQAVKFVLRSLNISYITASRSILPGVISFNDLSFEYIQKSKLIINCTPMGMFPDIHVCPPIDYSAIGKEHLCFDLIYNPAQTVFLEKCVAQGATICNGQEMLALQADAAFDFFKL
jgi:shikimate dehydrogenase